MLFVLFDYIFRIQPPLRHGNGLVYGKLDTPDLQVILKEIAHGEICHNGHLLKQ